MSAEVLRFPSDRELAAEVARRWLALLAARVPANASFTVALSGGRITKTFFAELVTNAAPGAFAGVHFFWADERCLPPDHAESNFALANANLFAPLGVAADCIHRLRGEADPAFALAEADAEICRVAELRADGMPVLDLVLLGLGEDGHVASLFPNAGTEVESARTPFLHITNSPKPPPERLTLSYAAIAAARAVWVLASGKGKEAALRDSLAPGGLTPLGKVLAAPGASTVFTDCS